MGGGMRMRLPPLSYYPRFWPAAIAIFHCPRIRPAAKTYFIRLIVVDENVFKFALGRG